MNALLIKLDFNNSVCLFASVTSSSLALFGGRALFSGEITLRSLLWKIWMMMGQPEQHQVTAENRCRHVSLPRGVFLDGPSPRPQLQPFNAVCWQLLLQAAVITNDYPKIDEDATHPLLLK